MLYDIRSIQNINHLIMYFSKVLNWNIDTDSFDDIDDISYDFSAADLGLKEEAFAKIKSIKQLPPMVDGQKWGIFCIEFDSKRFEVTALRKVLSGLVPSRRNSADHAVWSKEDLLFLCFWGEDNNRTIGIAHFEDKQDGLPQIKMTYCAPAIEDTIHIQDFFIKISNLTWPLEVNNHQKWHDDWSRAFMTTYKQVIRDSQTLTNRLALEALGIRDRILKTLEIEIDAGYVHQLYKKFRETLIHDMSEKDFADMYAQTVVYGLFSARCMDESQDDFSAAEAVDCIPNTNPFLKSLMKECLGNRENSKLSFDELEISNVVDLLMNTNTDEIIKDFNRQTGGGKEDPVIHFYEEFLTAYDKTQKVQRGVYYTPQPVVNFIIRAVDAIIKNDFELKDGLASTETKIVKGFRPSRKSGDYDRMIEDKISVPAIQILDPATGTGTFLRQTILQIYENFKCSNIGCSEEELHYKWNNYVPKHLLPRINAFELMMAPYAVAHMKLALVLKDTGYDFDNDIRLNVYLTNSLERPGNSDRQISFFDDPLASEAVSANSVKKNNGINVVVGNPPYSISSSNRDEWIQTLLSDYKKGLNEKKVNLDDDYIKFIRYGQYVVEKSGSGILAYITNNSFLDGITHREMRRQLMELFNKTYIINLHGNSKRKESTPVGGKDENVFDIQQGVCIFIGVISSGEKQGVFSYDLYGTRQSKYDFLREKRLSDIDFSIISPKSPNYFFVPKDFSNLEKYEEGFAVDELMSLGNSGIQTKNDSLAIQFDRDAVVAIQSDFKNKTRDFLVPKYNLKDSAGWKIDWAIDDIKMHDSSIERIMYRPYDWRYVLYTNNSSGFLGRPREKVSRHFVNHKNLGLLVRRTTPPVDFTHAYVCDSLISEGVLGIDPNGREYVFPLYLYPEDGSINSRIDNMRDEIKSKIALSIGVDSVSAFEIFCYIYACLYSNKYRKMYSEFLKIDYPKIPFPKTKDAFNQLVELGRKLIDCHLLKDIPTQHTDISFVVGNTNCVDNPKYVEDRIYINKNQYFKSVSEKAWNTMVGGYAPLQKWLKLRKGRNLTDQEIEEYKHIISSIVETEQLMIQIDEIIEL